MYDWRCSICDESNLAASTECARCGFPSVTGPGDDPDKARAALKSGIRYVSGAPEILEAQKQFESLVMASKENAVITAGAVGLAFAVVALATHHHFGKPKSVLMAHVMVFLFGVGLTNAYRLSKDELHLYIPISRIESDAMKSARVYGVRKYVLYAACFCWCVVTGWVSFAVLYR